MFMVATRAGRGDLLKSPAYQGRWPEGHTVVPGVRPELHDCGDDLRGDLREFGLEQRDERLLAKRLVLSEAAGLLNFLHVREVERPMRESRNKEL